MSAINQEDIFLILKLLEESEFDEIQLETGEIRLHAQKKGNFRGLKNLEQSGKQSAPAIALETKGVEPCSKGSPDLPAPVRKPLPLAEVPIPAMEGLAAIKSPMLGTFYLTPKPGAPPFVEVGTMVNKEDSVCIIEVMKLFNTVKAGVQGRIAKICAEQGQMVEYQQTLFLVDNKSA